MNLSKFSFIFRWPFLARWSAPQNQQCDGTQTRCAHYKRAKVYENSEERSIYTTPRDKHIKRFGRINRTVIHSHSKKSHIISWIYVPFIFSFVAVFFFRIMRQCTVWELVMRVVWMGCACAHAHCSHSSRYGVLVSSTNFEKYQNSIMMNNTKWR